ncbi:hypothetical protein BGW80DRAFT_329897 [Lactifluus volemus]|nr:hypothetical protein BGW80DRAFT_329897 [Lactifluus volemus]
MAAPQPPPANLKDRIAALQQRNGTPSPTASPTFPSRDASVTPPRGSLRDKIAKFEKRGGVPIPRGSFGMGVPPLEDTGSTKSRELYGNRVAALGKGRPTAPGNSGNRAVTSPSINLAATSNRTSPDANAAIPTANVAPNLISHSISLSTPLSRHTSSGLADRPASALGVVDKSDEAQQTPTEPADERQETLVQRGPIAQPESSSNTQDAMPSEPIDSAAKSTSELAFHQPPRYTLLRLVQLLRP